ncbi:hypothetical protein Cri9333_4855 (plasmid) [Crinalium epipsammum PCC 9333]|uniref:Uncharacterized protein n=1 Tax=Crinalium epipsammum PCC 9333 TaxID=1173022 RepID=K9W619_9CYAN|nr:hypothetical protein [Crinalium epipsammum]AFZ15621.1 hypothetical protein Cri9333_4855 [Crinalium epipsammum PCC 9333]
METFEPGIASAYNTHNFTEGEEGIKCCTCPRVMTIYEWEEKRRCFCQGTNVVPARARSAPPTRLESNRTRASFSRSRQNNIVPPIAATNSTINSRSTTNINSTRTQNHAFSNKFMAIAALILFSFCVQPVLNLFNNLSLQLSQSRLQIPPEQFMKNYYFKINSSKYEQAWEDLSPKFQAKSDLMPYGKTSYLNFWKSRRVEIESINLVDQKSNYAEVNIRLRYFAQSRNLGSNYISYTLIWNSSKNNWQIDDSKLFN